MRFFKSTCPVRSRILYAILALISIVVSGCRQSQTYKIGVSQCSEDDWRQKMNGEMLREVMYHPEVELEIRSADDSNEKQAADLRYFAENKFDVIIVSPNESQTMTPEIDKLMAQGIPVVVFDREVTNDNYTAFRGADNDSIGFLAARYARHLTGDKGKVVEIYGLPGSSPADDRHKGFMRGLVLSPDMSLAATGIGNWQEKYARRAADSLLRLHPDAALVYAHNDRMAITAREVADSLGLHPFVIGIDAAPHIGIRAVADGKIDATFLYPTEGQELIRTALAIAKGEPFERTVLKPAMQAVDKTNADILLLQTNALEEETTKVKDLKSEVDKYWESHNAQRAYLIATGVLLILALVLMTVLVRLYWLRKRQQEVLLEKNHELEEQRDREKELNARLNEATQSKLMFFTNVSHDLKTPLTLISGPVEELSKVGNLTPQQLTLAKIANKNVKILKRLINQILDFRKYENNRQTLDLTEADLAKLLEEWTASFEGIARRRHIKLRFEAAEDAPEHVAIDVEKIERVFFNVLSNAFKYTPDNGIIVVACHFTATECQFSVSDNGKGIAPEDLPNIFMRFFQVDKVHPNGSGIGLSLAKAFVELHGGSIEAKSRPGVGSRFTITLPVRHVADTAAEVTSVITESDVNDELGTAESFDSVMIAAKENDPEGEAKPLLLVIDDNQDMLMMVSNLLGDQYRVITAPNGAEGVRMAAKYVPDLVLCDVMMPQMDGMECLRRIKSEITTSHIPVLMLTACTLDEQRVQAYESGADGYVSKPFNGELLAAKCTSLIANRKRIHISMHSDQFAIEKGQNAVADSAPADAVAPSAPAKEKAPAPAAPKPGDPDNEFYRKFIGLLNNRLGDSDINVDILAAEMGLGRSQFYRKIKALTNYSPVELIRNIRLKEARVQLLTTEKTVSEIAYATGFSTPAYFTKCYREAYGETPSETRAGITK
ncbi:MAG: substrate-binding domain-containing protein [Muribaculaceae bacterium]|nr:substrate-binding domain-containing protein [Muribaculaceae bacterium]